MMEWAREAGFDVPEMYLDDASGVVGPPARWLEPETKVLTIRRFDRLGGRRIHQEDFAQVVGAPPHLKYDNVTYEAMAILVRNILDEEACDEFVRRLALMIACGNNDGHLKNWSLLYPDGIRAAWSPIYDQVSTVGWPQPDRRLALKLSGIKDFGRIDREAFARFAGKAALNPERVLIILDETLVSLRDAWAEIGDTLPLPQNHREALREHWQRVPLLREVGGLG
jgi:serine/threonine-protein kinase HipA